MPPAKNMLKATAPPDRFRKSRRDHSSRNRSNPSNPASLSRGIVHLRPRSESGPANHRKVFLWARHALSTETLIERKGVLKASPHLLACPVQEVGSTIRPPDAWTREGRRPPAITAQDGPVSG